VSGDPSPQVRRREQWHWLGESVVRCWWFSPDPARVPVEPGGTAVLVPGLALPRYTLPLAATLARRGIETVVLDALAWRARARRVEPTIAGLSEATAIWFERLEMANPVVVVGHSTGAQVALEAVLRIQHSRRDLGLVMAGPTFQPDQRGLGGLMPAALTAYRKDTPKELVVLKDVARVRTDLVRIVQSARRHHSEKRVGQLRVPLTVTAGEADSFAGPSWLGLLAARAGAQSRTVVLPGSHNNVFTHPDEFGSLVAEALGAAREAGHRDPRTAAEAPHRRDR
jgi:surfactin synthase thioesterase subunit